MSDGLTLPRGGFRFAGPMRHTDHLVAELQTPLGSRKDTDYQLPSRVVKLPSATTDWAKNLELTAKVYFKVDDYSIDEHDAAVIKQLAHTWAAFIGRAGTTEDHPWKKMRILVGIVGYYDERISRRVGNLTLGQWRAEQVKDKILQSLGEEKVPSLIVQGKDPRVRVQIDTAGAVLSETPRSGKSKDELAEERRAHVESMVYFTKWKTKTIQDIENVFEHVGDIKKMEVSDSIKHTILRARYPSLDAHRALEAWQQEHRQKVAKQCRLALIPKTHSRMKELTKELKKKYDGKHMLQIDVSTPTYTYHDSKEHYYYEKEKTQGEGKGGLVISEHNYVYEHHMRAEIKYKVTYRH